MSDLLSIITLIKGFYPNYCESEASAFTHKAILASALSNVAFTSGRVQRVGRSALMCSSRRFGSRGWKCRGRGLR